MGSTTFNSTPMLSSLSSLLVSFLFLSAAVHGHGDDHDQKVHWTGDSTCTELICLNATLQGNQMHFQVTDIWSTDTGYIGLGFGKHMVKTPLVVLWPTSNQSSSSASSTVISQRFTDVYHEPRPVDDPPFTASVANSLDASWPPSNNMTTMSFTIPSDNSFFSDLSAVEMIWSYGRRHPEPRDDPNAHLWIHYRTGYITLNLTRELDESVIHFPSTGGDEGDHDHTVIAIHAVLLSLGFLFVLPAGSLVARYGRSFTVKWFPFHRMLNLYIAGPLIILGWVLGPIAVGTGGRLHFRDAHQTLGFLFIILYILQASLGQYIHVRRRRLLLANPKQGQAMNLLSSFTKAHPSLNVLHVALGLAIITLAFVQVRSGIYKFDLHAGFSDESESSSWRVKLFNIWGIVLPILYICGLVLLPRQFKQEREMSSDSMSATATHALTHGSSSPPDSAHRPLLPAAAELEDDDEDEDDNGQFSRPKSPPTTRSV